MGRVRSLYENDDRVVEEQRKQREQSVTQGEWTSTGALRGRGFEDTVAEKRRREEEAAKVRHEGGQGQSQETK